MTKNQQAVRNLPLQLAMFFSFHSPVEIPLVPKTFFFLLPHVRCASDRSPLSLALFLACTPMLSLSPSRGPPSLAVPLTYFMAHRQRQREECLLLSVVSRSVGQCPRMSPILQVCALEFWANSETTSMVSP